MTMCGYNAYRIHHISVVAGDFVKRAYCRVHTPFVLHPLKSNNTSRIIYEITTITMAINAAKAIIRQGKTALFICDFQEKFAKAIFEFDQIIQNSSKLIGALRLLNVPMLVSEQNPNSLGKTVPQLDISGAKGPFAKMQFSMCTSEISKELETICCGQKPESIILIGVETHVCVENTAIDLRRFGYEVHTVADCCSSRTQEDRLLALERMRDIGCHITTSENVIFKVLRNANNEQFKNILNLIKKPTPYTGLVPISKI